MIDNSLAEKLIKRIKSGDRTASDELTRLVYTDVLRFCAYRAKDLSDAEDLTQETFLRLFRYISSYTEKNKFKAYLFRLASNVCNDFYSDGFEAEVLNENLPDTSDDISSRDTAIVVRRAVSSLPASQREAVVLFYFNGLRIKEIADVQRVPSSTVRTRLNRGRTKLKEILTKEGF